METRTPTVTLRKLDARLQLMLELAAEAPPRPHPQQISPGADKGTDAIPGKKPVGPLGAAPSQEIKKSGGGLAGGLPIGVVTGRPSDGSGDEEDASDPGGAPAGSVTPLGVDPQPGSDDIEVQQPGGGKDSPPQKAVMPDPTLDFHQLFDMDMQSVKSSNRGDAARFFHGLDYDPETGEYMITAVVAVDPTLQPVLPLGPARTGDVVDFIASSLRGSVDSKDTVKREIYEKKGHVYASARLPLSQTATLADRPDVVFIEASRPMRRQDTVDNVALIGAKDWAPDATPLTGAGVLIGVIDVGGLDFHHPDFILPPAAGLEKNTRLWRLEDWDRVTRTYTVYERSEINADLAGGTPIPQLVVRRFNHPTAVTGVAAGNGRANNNPVSAIADPNFGDNQGVGVAPEANIYYVNSSPSPSIQLGHPAFGDSKAVMTAIRSIFAFASEKEVPCVINLSLGDTLGPHDGTSLVERFIDRQLSVGTAPSGLGQYPGRAVVVASGNTNQAKKHIAFDLDFDPRHPSSWLRTRTLKLVVPDCVDVSETIEIWYEGPELLVTIKGPPSGPPPMALEPSFILADPPKAFVRIGNKAAVVTVSKVMGDARNGHNCITIGLQPAWAPPIEPNIDRHGSAYPYDTRTIPSGTWEIVLEPSPGAPRGRASSTRAHAWIDTNTGIFWQDATWDDCTLTTPATSRTAISVGSYDTKENGLCEFSGRGPTRDRRIKPELVAPGIDIKAPSPGRQMPYRHVRGTSIAAPHVTGLIALIFEHFRTTAPKGPLPNTAQIRKILAVAASKGGLFSPGATASAFGFAHTPPKLPAALEPVPLDVNNAGPIGTPEPDPKLYPVYATRGDMQQIDNGWYEVYQKPQTLSEGADWPEEPVGWVLVEGSLSSSREHWALRDTYDPISGDNSGTRLKFVYQGSTFTYPGSSPGVPAFEAFMDAVSGSEEIFYIIADCSGSTWT